MLHQSPFTSLSQWFARAVIIPFAAALALIVVCTSCRTASADILTTPFLLGFGPTLPLYSSSRTGTIPAPVGDSPAYVSKVTHTPRVRDKDWSGVSRDTALLFGAQFGAVGVIYLMPESVSGWSREQKRESFRNYEKNVGHPAMDKDKFYINYVLHPYWGATYYVRARERGLTKGESVLYSTLISSMYEFGVEAFFERPSIQDLVVTPVAGSLLGAYLFEPLRDSIKGKKDPTWQYKTLMVLTDPVGVLSSGIEKITGRKSAVRVNYSPPHLQRLSTDSPTAPRGDRIGLFIDFPLK